MAYKYNDGSRSDELIKKMIPVMVLWSKYSWTEQHTYSDLQQAIQAKSPRLGYQLGLIDDIFKDLSKKHKRYIPTLNSLIVNSHSGLPSDGLEYVLSSYKSLTEAEKEIFVKGKNLEAHQYDYTWVIEELDLKFPTHLSLSIINELREEPHYKGGEGEAHKKLKQHIASNPGLLKIKAVKEIETERVLLSGDRLDVFIKNDHQIWAIEVKPYTSDSKDILRGIYQCVKYQSVLEAEKIITLDNSEIKTLLIVEREIPAELKEIANYLNINYISDFKIS